MIMTPNIIKVRKIIAHVRKSGKKIGFVPTMGALHSGHLSLVRAAKKECDFCAVSIFINPTQFGPREDYRKYPRTFKRDQQLLKKEKIDVIFHPSVNNMYLSRFSTYVEEKYLSRVLCGKSRPGHFMGVCTVVTKLFNIIQPDIAYFGQKDYQQAQIIKRMVRDLNFPVEIKVLPIIREKSGLALSSRNTYLDNQKRTEAASIYSALRLAKKLIKDGERNPRRVINKIKSCIFLQRRAKVEYIKIVNADNLRDVRKIKGTILVAMAVYFGKTRLIDNIVVRV